MTTDADSIVDGQGPAQDTPEEVSLENEEREKNRRVLVAFAARTAKTAKSDYVPYEMIQVPDVESSTEGEDPMFCLQSIY